MPLSSVVLVVVVIGVILYLVNNYIPMDTVIRKVLNAILIIILILWLLQAFGIINNPITVG